MLLHELGAELPGQGRVGAQEVAESLDRALGCFRGQMLHTQVTMLAFLFDKSSIVRLEEAIHGPCTTRTEASRRDYFCGARRAEAVRCLRRPRPRGHRRFLRADRAST